MDQWICIGVVLLIAWWILGMAGRRRRRVEQVVRARLEPGETIVATVSFAKFAESDPGAGWAALGGAVGGAVGGAIVGAARAATEDVRYVALTVTDRRILMVEMTGFGRARDVAAIWPRAAERARTESHLDGIDLDVTGLGERRDLLMLKVPMPHVFEVRRLFAEIGVKPEK